MKPAAVFLLAVLGVVPVRCVIMTEYDLETEIRSHVNGLPDKQRKLMQGEFVTKSVCGAKVRSSLNTTHVEEKNDGRFYGIFYLRGDQVCSGGTDASSHNICNVDCSDLIDDNIQDDIACLVKVMSRFFENPTGQDQKLADWIQQFYQDCL